MANFMDGTNNDGTPIQPPDLGDRLSPKGEQAVRGRAWAEGVQIYEWTDPDRQSVGALAWHFVGTESKLYFGDEEVAQHYAGPTWEANDGSKIVAMKLQEAASPGSIPWLLGRVISRRGFGVLNCVTYVQRAATEGGVAPSYDGNRFGDLARVPYKAVYYFWEWAL